MVVHDDSELFGELGDMNAPKAAITAQAGDKKERRAAAGLFVIKFRAVAQFEFGHRSPPP